MGTQQQRSDLPIRLSDFSGGINNTDLQIPENQCADARNIDWPINCLGVRRNGASDANGFSILAAFGAALIRALIRHTPTTDRAAEAWAISSATPPIVGRAVSDTFVAVAPADTLTSTTGEYDFREANGLTYNTKLFLAWRTAVDRLHLWDGTEVRRVGFVVPLTAPVITNTGAGAYAAVLRHYRIRWLQLSGTTVVRRSEPSPSVSFTPSGAGTAARVTRPTAASESETHWEVEASPDGANFFRLAQVVIATTTYDDSAAITSYANNPPSQEIGLFVPPWSAKYLVLDGDRLLFAGSWLDSALESTVGWTPILGTLNHGDDERTITGSASFGSARLVCEPNCGGPIVGMHGPLHGEIYVFKRQRIYRLSRTNNAITPYSRDLLTDKVGAIGSKAIRMGEDERGEPALYFISQRGPYRLGSAGIEYLGRDIEKTWRSLYLGTVASSPPFGEYEVDTGRMHFWIAFNVANNKIRLTFTVKNGHRVAPGIVRGGWGIHDGSANDVNAAFSFDDFPLLANRTEQQKIWVAGKSLLGGGPSLLRQDTIGASTDSLGGNYKAYVKSGRKTMRLAETLTVVEASLQLRVPDGYSTNKTLQATTTIHRNYDALPSTSAVMGVVNQTEASPTVIQTRDGLACSGNTVIQVEIGNAAAVDEVFQLEEAVIYGRTEATVIR